MLIEVDGHYVSPVWVDHLEIHTGQRYSVLFQSKTDQQLSIDRINGKTQYWIQFETRSRALITTAFAVLAYDDADTPDLFTQPSSNPLVLPAESFTAGWLEDELHSLPERPYDDSCPELSEVTRRIVINVQQVQNGTGLMWHQNGAPWFERSVEEPYLVSLYKNIRENFPDYDAAIKNGKLVIDLRTRRRISHMKEHGSPETKCHMLRSLSLQLNITGTQFPESIIFLSIGGYDPKTKTFPAKLGEVLEIVWQNVGRTIDGTVETHPFHVHSEHIWDVGCGTGSYSPSVAEIMLQEQRKHGGPIKRDTTNLYRTKVPETSKSGDVVSWRAWRLRVRNPGVWMIHCHILQHMMMGMQTVFVFGGKNDLRPLTPEQAGLYLEFGGAAYGNATYSPRVLHFWHD